MIVPEQIPQFTGDLGLLETACGDLKADASHVRSTGRDVHRQFQGLRGYYTAPEAEQLFATTKPVEDRADGFADGLEKVSSALSSYATEIRPLVERLKQLKIDAADFVNSVEDDEDWEYDGGKVDEHNRIRDEVTAAVAAFWAAERTCHNKITALFGGTQMVAGDGSDRKDQYGFDAADMKNAKLPWGDPVEEKHHWYEVGHWVKSFVWDGLIVDGVWGTIKGLGTLVGFGGWDAMGQAWKGLAQLATGLAISSIPGVGTLFWALPDDKLPSWFRDSRTAMKETGKALVAWDEWGKNPARAAGAVTFNVVTTVFTGGAGGAASGAGKAGAVAKALSVAGKAGRVIDPMTYVGKAAGAGLSKIGDVTAALKGIGKIDVPTLPDGSVHLPDGRLLDTNGNLIGHDGTIDTTPVPHEVAPGLPAHWTIQQPALSGVRAGDGVTDAVAAGGHYDVTPGAHYDPPGQHLPAGHTPGGTFDGTPTSYDHAPAPSGHAPTTYDHAPTATPHDPPGTPHTGGSHPPEGTPHGTGHDTPPGGHTDDASHGTGHDGAGHDQHGGGHDGTGHTDDAVPGDHAGAPHDGVDTTVHDGTDTPGASGHPDTDVPGHGGAGEPFEYKPHMSHAEFNKLTDEQKHAVAAAELSDDTRPFADADEAIAYGREHWNDYVDNLDPVAQQSLRNYTGETFPSYHDINGHLREIKGYGPRPEVLHDIDQMDEVMSTRPVPDNIMVARGTDLGYLKLGSPAEMLGQTFPDKGYTSTSLGNHPVKTFEGKEAILRLRVPKGTPALWLEKVSHFDVTEREMLLARGTKFKVTRVFMDAKGQWQVYGEVLPRP